MLTFSEINGERVVSRGSSRDSLDDTTVAVGREEDDKCAFLLLTYRESLKILLIPMTISFPVNFSQVSVVAGRTWITAEAFTVLLRVPDIYKLGIY